MPGDAIAMTEDQLKKLVSDTAIEAVRGLNTPDPAQRPAAPATVSHVNFRRYSPPSLGKALKAAWRGQFRQSSEFEYDMAQAASAIFGGSLDGGEKDDPNDPIVAGSIGPTTRSIIWPKTRGEYLDVLYAMGEKETAKNLDRVDLSIRAMAEDQTVTVTAGSSTGSVLVPPQFIQSAFEYALTSTIALRQVPGVEVIPTNSNIVYLPRESSAAAAAVSAEAAILTTQDPTLAQQQFVIPKQYAYNVFSNEEARDSDPRWMEFLARTLVRNLALKQDQQFLEGTGSNNQMQGFVGYSGLTSGPSFGTAGRSPTFDDFMQAQYLLRVANAEPDFVISHPRVLNSLQQIKDSTGNYLMSNIGGYGAPRSFGTGLEGAPPKALLIGQLGMYFSSQMSIARTVGGSTDCTDVIVGQAQFVKILERQGVELAFSDQVYFNYDQSAMRAIGRATLAITQPTAVSVITGVRP